MSEYILTASPYQISPVLFAAIKNNIMWNYVGSISSSTSYSYSIGGKNLPVKNNQLTNWMKLSQFRELQDGWDGYDAIAIDEDSIKYTQHLLNLISFSPELFPTCRGTLQIEYEKKDREYLEFEIGSREIRSLHVCPDGKKTKKRWDICEEAFQEVVRTIDEFHGKTTI